MISLNVYLATTGGSKRDIMKAFGEGARLDGVDVCYVDGHDYRKSDFAMIFAHKAEGTDTPNHNFRQKVLDSHNDNIFFVDSNVLKTYEKDVRYFRFPQGSIHPHKANYMLDEDTSRNDQIMKDLNLQIKPWRKDGEHICLFLNRGIGGFSTFGKPCYEWARETVQEIRKYSDRPILIRSHRHAGETQQLKEDKSELDEQLENEIEGIKFPSHINMNNFELDDDKINEKIDEYGKLVGKKDFENISDILELNGELLSILKSYIDTLEYYNIQYDSSRILCSSNILWSDVSGNIRALSKGMLSRNVPKKKEIDKQQKLIDENLNRLMEVQESDKGETDKAGEADIDINDKEKLQTEKIEIEKELFKIQKDIRSTQEKINNINVGETKEDLVKLIEKWDKFSKRLDKKKEQLKVNQDCLKFFEDNLTIISKNEEECKNIEKQIKEINENDYPFNPDCECCMKQPWKIQLNNLENSLSLKQSNISSFKKKIEDKETELEGLKIEDIKNNIGKLEKWFDTYNQLKQNEKGCKKQLVLIEKKEELLHMNKNNYNTIDELNIKLDKINEKLTLIDEKINFDLWISKKEKNEKDKKDYEEFEKNILNNWKELQEYKSYLGDIIKDYENDKLNKENLEYWKTLLQLKPKWITYIEKKEKLKKKRKYHHNITNKYINYRKSYEIYEKECLKIKNYKELLKNLKLKLKGVDILIDIFNDYRIWLYKEKLFPLILNKLNLIISNMSNDDEELKLDISWNKDVFNWFIVHNGNKVIIDKASGYQKFIIDLSMRITLSTIGVSSLKCNQLFIDEGFSSCDQNHLSKIPSFLNSLLPIYNSILLVSHIQDIKNSSSSSYDIQRDNNLSIIDYGNKNNNITNMIKMIKKKK